MRNLIFLALFVLLFLGVNFQVNAQDNNAWINRINMIATQDCIDSVTCYTEVVVDVNSAVLTDSVYIIITIGKTPSASDIYNQRFQYTPSLKSQPNVSIADDGAIKISVGKYIVTEAFFVDMQLE